MKLTLEIHFYGIFFNLVPLQNLVGFKSKPVERLCMARVLLKHVCSQKLWPPSGEYLDKT